MSDTPPLGMRVAIRFSATYQPPAGVRVLVARNVSQIILRNVTEIHLGYETIMPEPRIAFESDVQSTGVTYAVSEIEEFETACETEKAAEFYETVKAQPPED